jgi:DNA-binding NtrC family response regulator
MAGEMILYVDDSPLLCDSVRKSLASREYRPLTALDAEEAIRIFKEHISQIDLVIIDINMPGIGGEQLFESLKQIKPDVRCVMSSGLTRSIALKEETLDHISGFLQKPFLTDALVAKINEALQGNHGDRDTGPPPPQ